MDFSIKQKQIMNCCSHVKIPRGRGATTACIMGALQKISNKTAQKVLIITNPSVVKNIENKVQSYMKNDFGNITRFDLACEDGNITLSRSFSLGYSNATITNNCTKSYVEIIGVYDDKQALEILNWNKMYSYIYVDGVMFDDFGHETIPCMCTDGYCFVESINPAMK